jgi:hypothetical protein
MQGGSCGCNKTSSGMMGGYRRSKKRRHIRGGGMFDWITGSSTSTNQPTSQKPVLADTNNHTTNQPVVHQLDTQSVESHPPVVSNHQGVAQNYMGGRYKRYKSSYKKYKKRGGKTRKEKSSRRRRR